MIIMTLHYKLIYIQDWRVGLDDSWTTLLAEIVAVNKLDVAVIHMFSGII